VEQMTAADQLSLTPPRDLCFLYFNAGLERRKPFDFWIIQKLKQSFIYGSLEAIFFHYFEKNLEG
jgi:hypothetical protein